MVLAIVPIAHHHWMSIPSMAEESSLELTYPVMMRSRCQPNHMFPEPLCPLLLPWSQQTKWCINVILDTLVKNERQYDRGLIRLTLADKHLVPRSWHTIMNYELWFTRNGKNNGWIGPACFQWKPQLSMVVVSLEVSFHMAEEIFSNPWFRKIQIFKHNTIEEPQHKCSKSWVFLS